MGGESEVVGGTERLFQRLCFRDPWAALPAGSLHPKSVASRWSGLAEGAGPWEEKARSLVGRNGFFNGCPFTVHGLRSRRDRST